MKGLLLLSIVICFISCGKPDADISHQEEVVQRTNTTKRYLASNAVGMLNEIIPWLPT